MSSHQGSHSTIEQAERAARLIEWIMDKRLNVVTPRLIEQYGPARLRRAVVAKEALSTLAKYGYVSTADGRVYNIRPSITDRY